VRTCLEMGSRAGCRTSRSRTGRQHRAGMLQVAPMTDADVLIGDDQLHRSPRTPPTRTGPWFDLIFRCVLGCAHRRSRRRSPLCRSHSARCPHPTNAECRLQPPSLRPDHRLAPARASANSRHGTAGQAHVRPVIRREIPTKCGSSPVRIRPRARCPFGVGGRDAPPRR
jgi:hypothetical protein